MKSHRIWFAAPLLATVVSTMAFPQSAPQSPAAGVFNLVSQTAASICGEIPNSGWQANGAISASVDAPLGVFFKKLFDAKLTGNAGLNGGAYAGPLREQLSQVRQDTQTCKRDVADRLLQYVQETQKAENVPTEKRVQLGAVKLITPPVIYPVESAEAFVNKWLALLDAGRYDIAYKLLDPSIRAMRSQQAFSDTWRDDYPNCFPVVERVALPRQMQLIPASQDMFRRDEYGFHFRTTFKGEQRSRGSESNEVVGVVVSERGEWRVIEYVPSCTSR